VGCLQLETIKIVKNVGLKFWIGPWREINPFIGSTLPTDHDEYNCLALIDSKY
jgi:hypothetical protein